MEQFKDKVAIVTGGASGIGRALCEEMARYGARLIVADLNAAGATEVAAAIVASGGNAQAAPLDVADADAVQRLVADTVAQHQRLDLIFNNAGIGVGGEVRDLELDHWRKIIDINMLGVIYGIHAAYPVMLKQGFGHIVNTASLAGLLGAPGLTPYAMTKFAVVGLSTSLRVEAEAFGVKVSAVCPGFVQSNIFESSISANLDSQAMKEGIPFKMMDTTKAARAILRGVARNQALIVFPFYARLLWRLKRLYAGLLSPFERRSVRELRALRLKK